MAVLHAELSRKVERTWRRVSGLSHINMISVWVFAGILLLPAAFAAVLDAHLALRSWYGLQRDRRGDRCRRAPRALLRERDPRTPRPVTTDSPTCRAGEAAGAGSNPRRTRPDCATPPAGTNSSSARSE